VFLLEGAEAAVRAWQRRLAIHRGCALEIADPSSVSATSANDRWWHISEVPHGAAMFRLSDQTGHMRATATR